VSRCGREQERCGGGRDDSEEGAHRPEGSRARAPPLAVTPPPPPPAPSYPATAWSRIALLPGLELSVRADAAEVVRRIAADIYAHYGAPHA
jgi:hypothetical protein